MKKLRELAKDPINVFIAILAVITFMFMVYQFFYTSPSARVL